MGSRPEIPLLTSSRFLRLVLVWAGVHLAMAHADAAQAIVDSFGRVKLADGPIAWNARGTWGLSRGVLVNRHTGRGSWLHQVVWFVARESLPLDCLVKIDILHRYGTRRAGYAALRAVDSKTKAYVEFHSNCSGGTLSYRTSDSEPHIESLGTRHRAVRGQFASCAIRWKGFDPTTGKGSVELLYARKASPQVLFALVARGQVANLRSLDKFELVLNADTQWSAARAVMFDNFRLEVSPGPDLPRAFEAAVHLGRPIELFWKDIEGEAAYVLERAVGGDGEWKLLARLPADTTGYTDRDVRPAVPLRYRLSAESPKGRSTWTRPLEVMLPGPPPAPTRLQALVLRSGQACLDWHDNAANENGFIVMRRQREEGEWQAIRVLPPNAAAFIDLPPHGAPCAYRVRAANVLGPSGWSNVVVASPPPRPPAVVRPAGRIVYAAEDDLPVASVDIVFDRQIVSEDLLGPKDFTLTAHRHPWHHATPLPEPKITAVTYDADERRARVAFEPPIPDLIEYRIRANPTITNAAGVAVSAPPVRVAVLLGDDDGEGFVAPAEGKRLGKRLAMPPMPVGIMGEDIEWDPKQRKNKDNVAAIIKLMDAYRGIDFFRINLWWDVLEPEEGKLDARYVGFLRRVLAAAEKRQLPLEIGIRQVRWPLWVCRHSGFSPRLYEPGPAAKLAATWRRVAAICGDSPVVFAYWVISEEYPSRDDLEKYLAFLDTVTEALRAAHPGCVVKARPHWAPEHGGHEVVPAVVQRGAQDICMAAGFYPTGAQWDIKNPNPLTPASFNNLQAFRYFAPAVQGGANGIGEIGFRAAPDSTFGDAERLLAFQRALSLAYDLGMDEYVIWGESWSFDDPATWFPRLLAFRDALLRYPTRRGFDLRLVNDVGLNFIVPPTGGEPETNLRPAFRWLEERGYRYTLAAKAALPLLKAAHKVSVNLSDLAGEGAGRQTAVLRKALRGVQPTGRVLPWLRDRTGRHSLTGLPCHLDVRFLHTRAVCDAVSLSPTRLQLYAPKSTRVRWRRLGADAWHDLTTAKDSRVTIVELETPEPPKPRPQKPPATEPANNENREPAPPARH